MIKTIITNKLHTGRHVRWANIWLDAGQTAVLDGAYPYASKARKAEQSFDEELDSGALEVTYATDLPCVDMCECGKAVKKAKDKVKREAAKAKKAAEDAKKAKAEAAAKAKEEAEAAKDDEDEGDAKVFKKGSIEDAMGEATQVAGTVAEVTKGGETEKLAGRMDMDVATVDTDDKNKKNIQDPLLQAGSVVGEDNWPNITDAAQKMLEASGITKAEAGLIKGTGSDGRLIQKDVKAYLKQKNGE